MSKPKRPLVYPTFSAWFKAQFGTAKHYPKGDLKEQVLAGDDAAWKLQQIEIREAQHTAALYGWTAGFNASNAMWSKKLKGKK